MMTESIASNKELPNVYRMKLDYIRDQAAAIEQCLATDTSRVAELEIAVAEARETEVKEKRALDNVMGELEAAQREEEALREELRKAQDEIDAQASIKARLIREIDELQREVVTEKDQEEERHNTLKKVFLEQRKCYNEIQNIKGNVRVCIRLRPEYVTPSVPVRTAVPHRAHPQPAPPEANHQIVNIDIAAGEVALTPPPIVAPLVI